MKIKRFSESYCKVIGESLNSSLKEVENNISILEDIFVDISDERVVEVIHILLDNNVYSMLDYIFTGGISNQICDKIMSDSNFYDFCFSLLEFNIYKVVIGGYLDISNVKEIQDRCKYQDFHIIHILKFHSRTYIIFAKNKDEIIQKIMSYSDNKINESKDEISIVTESDILELRDVFENIMDDHNNFLVMVEKSNVSDYDDATLIHMANNLLSPLDQIKITSGMMGPFVCYNIKMIFKDSIAIVKIFNTFTDDGILENSELFFEKVCQEHIKRYLKYGKLKLAHSYFGRGFCILSFLKNRDKIVDQLIKAKSYMGPMVFEE